MCRGAQFLSVLIYNFTASSPLSTGMPVRWSSRTWRRRLIFSKSSLIRGLYSVLPSCGSVGICSVLATYCANREYSRCSLSCAPPPSQTRVSGRGELPGTRFSRSFVMVPCCLLPGHPRIRLWMMYHERRPSCLNETCSLLRPPPRVAVLSHSRCSMTVSFPVAVVVPLCSLVPHRSNPVIPFHNPHPDAVSKECIHRWLILCGDALFPFAYSSVYVRRFIPFSLPRNGCAHLP